MWRTRGADKGIPWGRDAQWRAEVAGLVETETASDQPAGPSADADVDHWIQVMPIAVQAPAQCPPCHWFLLPESALWKRLRMHLCRHVKKEDGEVAHGGVPVIPALRRHKQKDTRLSLIWAT